MAQCPIFTLFSLRPAFPPVPRQSLLPARRTGPARTANRQRPHNWTNSPNSLLNLADGNESSGFTDSHPDAAPAGGAGGEGPGTAEDQLVPRKLRTRRAGAFFRLAALILAGLGGPTRSPAQTSLPPLWDALPPSVPVPAKAPSTSLVFPDGGFPDYLNSPGGSIPTRVALPGLGDLYPPLMPTPAEYDQRGLVPRGVQQPPGVPELFRPTAPPLPDYFYQPGYYYDPTGIGARPLADYGPPGHAPREDPQGEAPGVPQFTPITPPEPITAEERQKFVTRGEFPGSFLVPGTNTSFRFRGFVRLVALYDFNPIDLKDQFVTSFIPVPQQHGENFNLSARISRIALETWTPTTFDQWTVHTFIDVDFISGPDQSFSGGSNFFRLRNAFADFGYFRLASRTQCSRTARRGRAPWTSPGRAASSASAFRRPE